MQLLKWHLSKFLKTKDIQEIFFECSFMQNPVKFLLMKLSITVLSLFLATSLSAATMAVNVLVTTDDASKEWADQTNKEIFKKYPQGYRIDDSHLSHISLYQAYVEISCLDEKWDDVEKEAKHSKLLGEKLKVIKLRTENFSADSPLSNLQLQFSSSEKILHFQKRMMEVLSSCRSDVENQKAFYGTVPAANPILAFVKNYSTQNTGPLYTPVMNLGVAPKSDADKILSEFSSPPTEVTIKRIGVFRSGLFGTARERLFSHD